MSYKETLLQHHPALVALRELTEERDDVYFKSSEIAQRCDSHIDFINWNFDYFKKIGLVKYRKYGNKNWWAIGDKKKAKREITANDIDTIMFLSKRGETDEYISNLTGISRQTVNKYKNAKIRNNRRD